MKKQSSFQNNQPTLFLVATPIGNLLEMTPRAIETLKSVEVIAAEDTRNTIGLLRHFNIDTKLIAHHKFNEKNSAKGLIKLLEEGKDIALVSDAGFPLICDPGSILVKEVIESGYNVVVVSGSSALLNGLVASGISPSPFYFHGFLSHHDNQAREELNLLVEQTATLVFYEAVHRIKRSLKLMLEVFGNREVCVARELTKLYEEYLRGSISEVLDSLDDVKGEFVIIVEGKLERKPDIALPELQILIEQYIQEGCSTSEAIKKVAQEKNISKNILYKYIHQA